MKLRTLLPIIFIITAFAFTACESDTANNDPFESLPVIDFTEDVGAVTIISDDESDNFISDVEITSPTSDDNQVFSVDSGLSDSSGVISIIDDISDSFLNSSDVSISENDNFSATVDIQNSVWIPGSGKKYHKTSDCSNMKSPQNVSLQEAKELGYEPCKRCYK